MRANPRKAHSVSRQLGKKHLCLNSVTVKGGRRHAPARSEGLTSLSENGTKTISEAAASSGRAEGLTSLSEGSNNNSMSSRQLGKKYPSSRFNAWE